MMRSGLLNPFLLGTLRAAHGGRTYDSCDSDAVRDTLPLSSLTPNQFHKICPGTSDGGDDGGGSASSSPAISTGFGSPGCGDGTPFAFFASRPPQKYANADRILIEFMGGGACWDAETCGRMSDRLTFPEDLNEFVGRSCSEIGAGLEMSDEGGGGDDDVPASMLCSRSVGDVNFASYNTVVVPYCTQDVHAGSNAATYGDGTTVRHVGAHNAHSVLRWVFRNFRNPSHVALTGCSAGGTILPVAYALLDRRYNSILRTPGGVRAVQISVVDDSPVYLTPSYFLENALGNWNPGPMMRSIGFRYDKWRGSEGYPTAVWDYVLRRGSDKDRWGFVTHTDDPVSQTYYKYMSGKGDGNNNNNADDDGRRMEDGDGDGDGDSDLSGQWWSQLSESLDTIRSDHPNVDAYLIDGEGHCSFGLYYALKEDGFEEWASSVFREDRLLGVTNRASLPLFAATVLLGGTFLAGAIFASKARHRTIAELDDVALLDGGGTQTPGGGWALRLASGVRSASASLLSSLARFGAYPITAAYGLAVTFYFWSMIAAAGFAHPLNNPSLGPSAIALSSFGINNPSLIVYDRQTHRLATSCLLCSGVLTYLIVAFCLWRYVRRLEEYTGDGVNFALAALCVALGCNLAYALGGRGASCSAASVTLGLCAFFFVLEVRRGRGGEARCMAATTALFFILTAVCFPFDGWVMLLAAAIAGPLVALLVFDVDRGGTGGADERTDADVAEIAAKRPLTVRMTPLKVLFGILLALFLVLVSGLRRPDEAYRQPYLTGCELMFSDEVGSLAGYYSDGDNEGQGRLLEDGDSGEGQNLCAQFCIPRIVARHVRWGANRLFDLTVEEGTCEDNGYDEHFADKTFRLMSYSLDTELYYDSGYGQ